MTIQGKTGGAYKEPVQARDSEKEKEILKEQEPSEVKTYSLDELNKAEHEISYEEFKQLDFEEKEQKLSELLNEMTAKKLADYWGVNVNKVYNMKYYYLHKNHPDAKKKVEKIKKGEPKYSDQAEGDLEDMPFSNNDNQEANKEEGLVLSIIGTYSKGELKSKLMGAVGLLSKDYNYEIELKMKEK